LKSFPHASLLFILLLPSFTAGNISDTDKLKSIPAHQLLTHSSLLSAELSYRIKAASPVIIDYLNKMDSTDRYKNYKLNDKEKVMFTRYFNMLPSEYKKIISTKVAAIYFIENFSGGGMSDTVFDSEGNLYIALYFNSRVLHRNLKEWIEERDNSMFLDDLKNVQLKINTDKKYPALLHTMVHEASHIYDFYYHITPYVDPDLKDRSVYKRSKFTSEVWDDYYKPVIKYRYPGSLKLSFYGLGKPVSKSEAVAIYRKINTTPFSSVYGSTSWAEDFAETFTWYYLYKKFGIKYSVIVSVDGIDKVIFTPSGNPPVTSRCMMFENLTE